VLTLLPGLRYSQARFKENAPFEPV